MKANKFFAAAMAALALVGFSSCKDKNDDNKSLELTETSISMKVGETHQLVANVTVETWSTSDEKVATVDKGMVTAVAEGTAIISATAKGTTKTCVVKVAKEGQGGGGTTTAAEVKGSQIWPVILDGVTYETCASKVVADFRVDDTNNFLYVWASGETYSSGDGTGVNFFGNNEGYVSLIVKAPEGWSGCGFNVGAANISKMKELRDAIVASPDDFYLHLAMKATTTGNHQFYTFAEKAASFAVGTATIEAGAVIGDFTRDGAWHEFDVPMAQFAAALSKVDIKDAGCDIFSCLSGAQAGSQLNLDAVYFYKK